MLKKKDLFLYQNKSTLPSLPPKGEVTKRITVEWAIAQSNGALKGSRGRLFTVFARLTLALILTNYYRELYFRRVFVSPSGAAFCV